MNIELVLSPLIYPARQLREHHTTVAIDILRASSAICAAFCAGAERIVPLDTLDELSLYQQKGFLLAAERDGKKVSGATCGNSPTEYLATDLKGKQLAYSTTNGTVSILAAAASDSLYVGAFSNLAALGSRLFGSLQKNDDDSVNHLVILCSGWRGDPCIEDTLFGGALIDFLLSQGLEVCLVNDAAMMSLDLWHQAQHSLYSYCAKATHVHRLQKLGCDDDIRWALTLNTTSVVPFYEKSSHSLINLEP